MTLYNLGESSVFRAVSVTRNVIGIKMWPGPHFEDNGTYKVEQDIPFATYSDILKQYPESFL